MHGTPPPVYIMYTLQIGTCTSCLPEVPCVEDCCANHVRATPGTILPSPLCGPCLIPFPLANPAAVSCMFMPACHPLQQFAPSLCQARFALEWKRHPAQPGAATFHAAITDHAHHAVYGRHVMSPFGVVTTSYQHPKDTVKIDLRLIFCARRRRQMSYSFSTNVIRP